MTGKTEILIIKYKENVWKIAKFSVSNCSISITLLLYFDYGQT